MTQTKYLTLTDAKAYLGIADTDTSSDAFLTNLIDQLTTFVETYTHRTFGWGDTLASGAKEDVHTDWSNTDNIGILSASQSGNNLTITTMGMHPWKVGHNVSVFGSVTPAWNGVWEVTDVGAVNELTVDISTSKGTLSLSNSDPVTLGALPGNFQGYIGNYVSNYRYVNGEQYDGLVGKIFYLRNSDIRSVDNLYIGLRNIAQPVLLNHTQYVWRDDGRIILGGAYFNSYDSSIYSSANDNSFYGTVAAGYQTITISYWHGMIDVPADIEQACLDIASYLYNLRKSGGLQDERVGDYQVRYDIYFRRFIKLNPDILDTLNTYRRRHLG